MIIERHNGRIVTETEYRYEFTDENRNGFSFPCDADGAADFNCFTQEAINNFDDCVANQDKFYFVGVREYRHTYHEPNYGICSCGETVIFDRDNNYYGAVQCPKCDQWYNLFGQELIDPKYWDYGYDD